MATKGLLESKRLTKTKNYYLDQVKPQGLVKKCPKESKDTYNRLNEQNIKEVR